MKDNNEIFHGPDATLIDWLKVSSLARRVLQRSGLDMDTVYQAFSTINPEKQSQAAKRAIGKLWYSYPELGPYPFLDTLSDFEYNRVFYPDYREHVNHQFRVFWLGLYLFDECGIIKERVLKEASSESAFLRRWHACAIWHDIGYVFENEEATEPAGDAWKETCKALNDTMKTPLAHFPQFENVLSVEKEWHIRRTKKINFIGLDTPRDMEFHHDRDLLDLIAEFGVKARLGPSLGIGQSPFRLYYDYAFQYPPESENRSRFRDHGIAGAMLLLKIRMEFLKYIEKLSEFPNDPQLVGISPQLARFRNNLVACGNDVLSSAAAIALHNIQPLLWREKHTLPYGLTLANFRIPLFEKPGTDTMALAFLLGLSDTLQTWDRQKFKAVRVDDKTGVDSSKMMLFVRDRKINLFFDDDNIYTDPGNIPDSKFGRIRKNLTDYLDTQAVSELLVCDKSKGKREGKESKKHSEKDEYLNDAPYSTQNLSSSNNKKVFICYRHREPDRKLAFQFRKELEKAGVGAFIDSEDIKLGDQWVDSIKNGIEQSDCVLLLLSEEAAQSESVIEEVSLAKEYRKVILPVRIQYPFEKPLPYMLSIHTRTIHQEYWESEDDTTRIIKKILNTLNKAKGFTDLAYETRNKNSTEFFHVGGTLYPDSPGYIERPADKQIVDSIKRNELCLVLGPRQTGKSSLMVKAISELKKNGIQSIFIDLQLLRNVSDSERFFGSIAIETGRGFDHIDTAKWWDKNRNHDPGRRYFMFLEDFLLNKTKGRVVVFMDEIDAILDLPFSDHLFVLIRELYVLKQTMNPKFKRLNFVVAGFADPSFFIKDGSFNIGKSIFLEDFSETAVKSYENAFGWNSDKVLKRIHFWTNGQPFLVQKLVNRAYERLPEECFPEWIDEEVEKLFSTSQIEQEPHLYDIKNYLLNCSEDMQSATLDTYLQILCKGEVYHQRASHIHQRLILSGIVTAKNQRLVLRNRIYAKAFNIEWVKAIGPTLTTSLSIHDKNKNANGSNVHFFSIKKISGFPTAGQSIKIMIMIASKSQDRNDETVIPFSDGQLILNLSAKGVLLKSERVQTFTLSDNQTDEISQNIELMATRPGNFQLDIAISDPDGNFNRSLSIPILVKSREKEKSIELPSPYGSRPVRQPDLTLRVNISKKDKANYQLQYIAYSPLPELSLQSRLFGKIDIPKASLSEIREHLFHLVSEASNHPLAHMSMRIIGTRLYDMVFPQFFKDEYWRTLRTRIRTILILTEAEPDIPWELIKPYNGKTEDEFWGERLAITRVVEGLGAHSV